MGVGGNLSHMAASSTNANQTMLIQAGYRLIVRFLPANERRDVCDTLVQDSAEWYGNENEVGRAILDFCEATNVPRSDIFYTSKLKNNNGYKRVKKSIERSVKECGLGIIDLYLMHSPIGGKKARQESWKAICDSQKEGLIRSIGISNFGIPHVQDILDLSDEGAAPPVVHQVHDPTSF